MLLDGQAIASLPSRQVARTLGLLPQNPVTPEGVSVVDLVGRGRHPHQGALRRWSREDEQAVAEALELTDTLDLADRLVDELSGGQRQRVWIAMALAQETDLLLLDEPTTYLDVAHQVEVLDLLAELNEARGTTIVMVLHDLNLAARYADHLVAMCEGRIVAAGPPAEVITEDCVRDVFGMDCRVIEDPVTGHPHGGPARSPLPTPTTGGPHDQQAPQTSPPRPACCSPRRRCTPSRGSARRSSASSSPAPRSPTSARTASTPASRWSSPVPPGCSRRSRRAGGLVQQLAGDPDDVRSPMRTYTIRDIVRDGDEVRLVIDFVVHDDHGPRPGPACRWALAAQPGDVIQVIAPHRLTEYGGTEFDPAGRRHLLLFGDETAVPAIARILADLGPGYTGEVFVEVPTTSRTSSTCRATPASR